MKSKVDKQPKATMPKRRDLPATQDDTGFVVVDPEIGSVRFFNPAAAIIWACCDGKTTLRQCAQRIRRRFLTPPFADVSYLIREQLNVFRKLKLVNDAM